MFNVHRSFIVVVAAYVFCGAMMHPVAARRVDVDLSIVTWTVVFVAFSFLMIAIHETGHAVVGRWYGAKLQRVNLGMKFGVVMLGDYTPQSIRVIAAAGPVAGGTVAGFLLLLTDPFTVLWCVAVFSFVDNIANIVLFFVPGSDGSKIFKPERTEQAPAPV